VNGTVIGGGTPSASPMLIFNGAWPDAPRFGQDRHRRVPGSGSAVHGVVGLKG
jgi:hypothetical protein